MVLTNSVVPVPRIIVTSYDPTEDLRVDTVSDALIRLMPGIIKYANRHKYSPGKLYESQHVVGLRWIDVHGYKGIGLSLWQPWEKSPDHS